MSPVPPANRRDLATRRRAWPSALARLLAGAGATPNLISMMSVVFAGLAALAYCVAGSAPGTAAAGWLVLAAVGIQLRLLCNLLDGLLAIEVGLKSKTGELFNEMPDRIGDILILLGAGLAVSSYPQGMPIAVAATLLAVLTAYVRLLGGSLGFVQDFSGPMAKQHRMFALTVGTLAAAVEVWHRGTWWALYAALAVIVAGTMWTLARRTLRIAAQLRAR